MNRRVCGISTVAALTACCIALRVNAADTYPQGTLAFFNLSQCPAPDWVPATVNDHDTGQVLPWNGYFLVPFYSAKHGALSGWAGTNFPEIPAMPSGENQHQHNFSNSVSLTDVEYAGSTGGDNYDVAPAGAVSVSAPTGWSNPAVPYVQLLICKKQPFTRNPNPPVDVPQEVVTFFGGATCPNGWKQTPATSGRFIVGTPLNGTPEAAFGGNPLTVGEHRTHTHPLAANLTIPSAGIFLATGCCAHGFGAAGSYVFNGATGPAEVNLPYVVVTQCQPCIAGDQDPACQQQ